MKMVLFFPITMFKYSLDLISMSFDVILLQIPWFPNFFGYWNSLVLIIKTLVGTEIQSYMTKKRDHLFRSRFLLSTSSDPQ